MRIKLYKQEGLLVVLRLLLICPVGKLEEWYKVIEAPHPQIKMYKTNSNTG